MKTFFVAAGIACFLGAVLAEELTQKQQNNLAKNNAIEWRSSACIYLDDAANAFSYRVHFDND